VSFETVRTENGLLGSSRRGDHLPGLSTAPLEFDESVAKSMGNPVMQPRVLLDVSNIGLVTPPR
jgi:hypothetical protein